MMTINFGRPGCNTESLCSMYTRGHTIACPCLPQLAFTNLRYPHWNTGPSYTGAPWDPWRTPAEKFLTTAPPGVWLGHQGPGSLQIPSPGTLTTATEKRSLPSIGVSNAGDVDTEKLQELEEFAALFKGRRIKLGYTQTHVGESALGQAAWLQF